MKWNLGYFGVTLTLVASLVSRGAAQSGRTQSPTPAQLREMIIEDSLTPVKMELRNYVAELRDTLNTVSAVNARIARNNASGIPSVVLSDGRELGKRCRISGAEVDLTSKRVAGMHTNNPNGDQAMSAYRAGLSELMDDLRTCHHDDSLAMAVPAPDPKRIEQVASAARAAITRYDAVRDALMALLKINLPVKGTMGRGGI